MKQFLAVYTGTTAARERSGFDQLNAADRAKLEKEGMAAWMAWGQKHNDAIVFNGGPLGKTKRAGLNGVTDIKNNLAGFVIVQAESHEAAAKMFEGHPHFAMFPGEAVEIVECLPLPGQ